MVFELRIRERKEPRKYVKVNSSRLALLTGYHPSHISRVLRRITTPSVKCLEALAQVLDLDIAALRDAIKERRIKTR